MLCRGLALWALALTVPAAAQQLELRPEPSALAEKAGSAIPWLSSLSHALEQSEASGKPVFWYVPTVDGSPMERLRELDFYMRAGPFSWPRTVAILSEHFVPLRRVPTRRERNKYRLLPLTFVEPGYLVLNADGSERERLCGITTLHQEWFVRRLRDALPIGTEIETPPHADLPEALYRSLCPAILDEVLDQKADDDTPESWRWKLAAEREGLGPLRYGFESPFEIPEDVLEAPAFDGSRAPAGVYDAAALRERGMRFFVWMQQEDGSFRDSRYDFGGEDSMLNVWTAITALAGRALLDVIPRLEDEELRKDAKQALDRAVKFLADDSNQNRLDKDEFVWAQIYRLRFFRDWIDRHDGHAPGSAVMPMLQSYGNLAGEQLGSGSWRHEYANPFVTASALLAFDALQRGDGKFSIGVGTNVTKRAIAALLRSRADDGSIRYSDDAPADSVTGSASRMPLVEHALHRFGAGEDGALLRAIRQSFQHHDLMDRVRRYDHHASPFGYGGFFFWYAMHGRAEAIQALPDGPDKTSLKARLRAQVLSLPEIDGCFVDSHELGRVYGTAMALICLSLTDP